jgi:hypothetical protein
MTRRKLITVAALAVLALACSESVGGILEDAGAMLADAGDMMQPDAGADFSATCNVEIGLAEFPVSRPGETMVTICYRAGGRPTGPQRAHCTRVRAWWYEGTNDGFVYCNPDTTSVTVHD